MKTHITVAFLGEFRPLHIEAENLKTARKIFLSRCHSPEILDRFQRIWKDYLSDKRRGLNVSALSSDCGRLSVRLADYPRDTWLDSITDKMPLHPQLSYL